MKLTLYPVLLGLALVSAPSLRAEEAADPPPLSPSCRAPIHHIAQPAPLPHLMAALRSERRIQVMAIGSSSTVGVGASSPAKTYPAQLETILERTFKTLDVVVLNRGVSGELATATAERLQREIPLDQPDIVLWQVGTNDALAKIPAEAFKATVQSTVQSTVQWLKEHRIDTVLVGLQYSPRAAHDAHHTAIRQALREIASAENVPLVRRFDAMKFVEKTTERELLSRDGLHQNDLGYRCMAEHIARAVVVSAFSFQRLSSTSP
jgi:acyl-CoA thioesterase I